jgi:hypothetical protein
VANGQIFITARSVVNVSGGQMNEGVNKDCQEKRQVRLALTALMYGARVIAHGSHISEVQRVDAAALRDVMLREAIADANAVLHELPL